MHEDDKENDANANHYPQEPEHRHERPHEHERNAWDQDGHDGAERNTAGDDDMYAESDEGHDLDAGVDGGDDDDSGDDDSDDDDDDSDEDDGGDDPRETWREAAVQIPRCVVSPEELADGVFGGLLWFQRLYDVVAEELEIELLSPEALVLLRLIAQFAEVMRAPSIGMLAEISGWSYSRVSRLGRELVNERLATVARHRKDARRRHLELTEFGESIADVEDVGEKFWRHFVERLGVEGARDLALGIVRLKRQPQAHPPWII